jgi:hypothetical protein
MCRDCDLVSYDTVLTEISYSSYPALQPMMGLALPDDSPPFAYVSGHSLHLLSTGHTHDVGLMSVKFTTDGDSNKPASSLFKPTFVVRRENTLEYTHTRERMT